MVSEFIKKNWDECVRSVTEDDGTLIGLPYPYIVPSPKESLQEIYYWDTYFTCKGLYRSQKSELAKNCTDDMLYLVDRYGFMPNGNRTYYLSQSQPPVLSMMVKDVYDYYQDKEWLNKAYGILKKEYNFWTENRMTPIRLNSYGANPVTEEEAEKHYESICKRLNYKVPMDDHNLFAKSFLTDCESGWDFTSRCFTKQTESAYVDLNALLYIYEKNMAKFADILCSDEKDMWSQAAEERSVLMNKYMWNGTAFTDFNYKENKHSEVFSVASFYPLWAGVANKEQAAATVARLSELECEYGVAACAENDSPAEFQWDYPTGWAPLQYVMIRALTRYGYVDDAKRIAKKYTDVTEKMFKETGILWEKYNVLTGDQNTTADYKSREMMGWSAGVYLYAKDFLEDGEVK